MATPVTDRRSLTAPAPLHRRFPRPCPRHRSRAAAAALVVLSALALILPSTASRAARISEPDTVLYGRITERVGDREFLLTAGRLLWKLRTAGPAAREHTFAARLEPLGHGVYSYRLAIPHQALAYDLAVRPNSVGLLSAASPVQHLSVTLDGNPLTIHPAAVDGFSLDQTRRAAVLRVDLTLSANTADSDQDGLPDWWEDENAFDKFNPTDAARLTRQQPGPSGRQPTPASHPNSFAAWRQTWFPANQSDPDLEVFGQEDPDRDGVPNLLEYAFELDPTQPDPDAGSALPHAASNAGRQGVAFRRRASAQDLLYEVEISNDLFHWISGSEDLQQTTLGTHSFAFFEEERPGADAQRFFRVRVSLKP